MNSNNLSIKTHHFSQTAEYAGLLSSNSRVTESVREGCVCKVTAATTRPLS